MNFVKYILFFENCQESEQLLFIQFILLLLNTKKCPGRTLIA